MTLNCLHFNRHFQKSLTLVYIADDSLVQSMWTVFETHTLCQKLLLQKAQQNSSFQVNGLWNFSPVWWQQYLHTVFPPASLHHLVEHESIGSSNHRNKVAQVGCLRVGACRFPVLHDITMFVVYIYFRQNYELSRTFRPDWYEFKYHFNVVSM